MTYNLTTTILQSFTVPFNMVLTENFLTGIRDKYFHGPLLLAYNGQDSILLHLVLGVFYPVVLVTDPIEYLDATNLVVIGDVEWQPLWRPRSRVLVLLQNYDPINVRDWLQTLWNTSRIADAVIMIIEPDIRFYIFNPFDPNCGAKVDLIEVHIDEVFPEKHLGGINKCEIRYFTEWIMPYVARDKEEEGIEDLLFMEIVERLNATPKEMTLPPGQLVQRTKNDENELIGAAMVMKQHQADLMYSAFTFRNELLFHLEFLNPHTFDSLSWFVPPPQPIFAPAYLYLAFATNLWMLACATMLLTGLFLYFTSKSALTDLTALTLNLSASPHVHHGLLIFAYVYSLHLTTTYQASLFMLYSKTVMEKPIETIEEAADRGYLSRFFNYHMHLTNLTDHDLWAKLFKRANIADRQNPAFFYETRDFLLLVQVNPVRYYSEVSHVYDKYGRGIYQLPHRFLVCPVLFYMSRGNPLKNAVDSITQRLVAGGIVNHWLDNFLGPSKIEISLFADGNVTLNLFQLSGIFIILAIGLSASLTSFIVELFFFCLCTQVSKRGKQKRTTRLKVFSRSREY